MPRQLEADYDAIRESYNRWGSTSAVALLHGCSIPTVRRAIRNRDTVRTATNSPGGPGIAGKGGIQLAPTHPAAVNAVPMFPTQVREVGSGAVLKRGEFSAKIGSMVLKGKWRGLPIFTLTLEERATCPKSCAHWLNCYGNNSPYALRLRSGAALETRIAGEVNDLCALHPDGIAIRLHNLGDFYSVGYVRLWRGLIERHPALHVFGFSARIDNGDPIAAELVSLINGHWPRFAVRLSNSPSKRRATVSIPDASQKPADAVICPQQQGKTESCSTCALCWQSEKRIAFIQH